MTGTRRVRIDAEPLARRQVPPRIPSASNIGCRKQKANALIQRTAKPASGSGCYMATCHGRSRALDKSRGKLAEPASL